MKIKTHVAVGVAVTLPLVGMFNLIAFLGIIGNVAPDFDVILRIKHRTLTHSLLMLFVTTLLIFLFNYQIAVVWSLNYFTHLFLDSCTKTGTPFLFPFKKRYYGLKKIKTGESEDLFICLLAIFTIIIKFI
jgi:inner membrane protein